MSRMYVQPFKAGTKDRIARPRAGGLNARHTLTRARDTLRDSSAFDYGAFLTSSSPCPSPLLPSLSARLGRISRDASSNCRCLLPLLPSKVVLLSTRNTMREEFYSLGMICCFLPSLRVSSDYQSNLWLFVSSLRACAPAIIYACVGVFI